MSTLHFADLHGRRYAIPEEVLSAHEVPGAIPEGERVTGLEVDPPDAPAPGGVADGYVWRVRPSEDGGGVEYAVAKAEEGR